MPIDGFNELFNVVYIAKKLHDMGKYDLIKQNLYDTLDYDTYYECMYNLLGDLFAYHHDRYSESRGIEFHILSDPVIVDFYVLAGKYGKRNGIPDDMNPYIKAAIKQAENCLNFSYCLDWMLVGHTEPKRPFHSRLGLFIYQDDYVDLGCLCYSLIEMYDWFSQHCIKLSNVLHEDAGGQLLLEMGGLAA